MNEIRWFIERHPRLKNCFEVVTIYDGMVMDSVTFIDECPIVAWTKASKFISAKIEEMNRNSNGI